MVDVYLLGFPHYRHLVSSSSPLKSLSVYLDLGLLKLRTLDRKIGSLTVLKRKASIFVLRLPFLRDRHHSLG